MATPKTCSAVEVFTSYSATLLDAISEPGPLAWKLFQERIISDKTLQDVLVPGQSIYKMNSAILDAVRRAIKAKQELLVEFLKALDQQSPADHVATKMRSDMSELMTL